MKIMKKVNSDGSEDIIKVSEAKVDSYLSAGYSYTNRTEWKTKVRDIGKTKKEQTPTGEVVVDGKKSKPVSKKVTKNGK